MSDDQETRYIPMTVKQVSAIRFVAGLSSQYGYEAILKQIVAAWDAATPAAVVNTDAAGLQLIGKLNAENARLREALERLGSTEAFNGALDAAHATPEALWAELRARGEYARSALGEDET